jgi:hypothetical protein
VVKNAEEEKEQENETIQERRDRKPLNLTPPTEHEALRQLGQTEARIAFSLAEKLVEAGKTDLFQGYASSIISADLMHSAGLLSDQAYSAIFVMETIMGAITSVDSVLGAISGTQSPFAPSLKTLIDMGGDLTQETGRSAKTGRTTSRRISYRQRQQQRAPEVEEIEEIAGEG